MNSGLEIGGREGVGFEGHIFGRFLSNDLSFCVSDSFVDWKMLPAVL
jgi:hypothetical protein